MALKIGLTFDEEFNKLYEEYLLFGGDKLLDIEGISPRKLDIGQMSYDYFTQDLADASVDTNANANEEMSANNYQAEVTKALLKLDGYYLLWKYAKKRFGIKRAKELITAIWDGDVYFHDASGHGIQVPYCFAYSTQHIMIDGRPYGQLPSVPPKRADSFNAQVIETTMDLSQEFVGAVAPADYLVNLSWYIKREFEQLREIAGEFQELINGERDEEKKRKLMTLFLKAVATAKGTNLQDKKEHDKFFKVAYKEGVAEYDFTSFINRVEDKEIENHFQKFVHVMNNKFRVSGQSPFSNVSIFDRPTLNKLFEHYTYPDGTQVDVEYIMKVQKICARFMSKGDPVTGLPYRFPVMTANISVDEDRVPQDMDFLKFVAEVNCEKGFLNIYANEGSKIAMCCRFITNGKRMEYKVDTFGNGGLNIGSHRVVTINLPRIALEAERGEKEFKVLLDEALEVARDLLIIHREEILKRRVEGGFLKFFNPLKWFSLDMFFSTIGVVGEYEMCYYHHTPMEHEIGQMFTKRILKYIEDRAQEFSEETGHSFNIEEIPAESAAVKLAKKDKVFYGKSAEFELYSNQFVPLIADIDAIDRISITGQFMKYLSGGGILHFNIAEKINDAGIMEQIILGMLRAGVEHFAVNYGFGECDNGHTSIVGTGKTCPICGGQITDWMTRVIGYFTKVSSWGAVREQFEYPRRKFY